MTWLSDLVEIDRRFARSARLDADLKGHPPLVGYVMQASVSKSLKTMAQAQIDNHQGAFTWTGPYGGGKSSAALLVANLLAGGKDNRKLAEQIAGPELTKLYAEAFPEANGRWAVVPVTGSRLALRETIASAAREILRWNKTTFEEALGSDEALVTSLLASAEKGRGGVLLILDELGKLLEHAVADAGDIHLLQDLAEWSARSAGRFAILGILHQSFDQYASRASREARAEWKKVQGRYQDISFLTGADETVALLARAIRSESRPMSALERATEAAAAIAQRRPTDQDQLAEALARTWPLNPVSALLLGPLSRQRFAQNERSVFGFLASAEPAGFQEHLSKTDSGDTSTTYDPHQLWDYLAANFSMAMAGGDDGGRISLAFEAIDRAAAKGGVLHVALTKSAAVLEFFRNGSGLTLSDDFLRLSVPTASASEIGAAVDELVDWAILMRQPRIGGYALFAGSDFDLEEAITKIVDQIDTRQMVTLPQRLGLGFATAKRHYFTTGALRTFEVALVIVGQDTTSQEIIDQVLERPAEGSGKMVLLVSDGNIKINLLDQKAKTVAKALEGHDTLAIGTAVNSYWLRPNATELFAIERISRENPQLEGDRIARRGLSARHSLCIDAVKRDLEAALDGARWRLVKSPNQVLTNPLSMVASALATAAFEDTPHLKSELLQRDKPSSNAMAALRELMHAMVLKGDQDRLGIEGYPAPAGLYLTTLKPFGLHREGPDGIFGFHAPDASTAGKTLAAVWREIETPSQTTLAEIYETWAKPPIGLKAGVMPVLALANILSRKDRLAVYVEGVFQTELDDVFVDRMLQSPSQIRLRRVERSEQDAALLEGLARRFGMPAETPALVLAQQVYQRFEALTDYAKRTTTLSPEAQTVRRIVLEASDPENLFIDALPQALGDLLSAELVFNALLEAEAIFGRMLEQLRLELALRLGVDEATFKGLEERAQAIKGLTNSWSLEGFAMRAAAFEHGQGDIEGLAGLLLHRSPRGWSDRDREQAFTELTTLGRKFRELETVATVRKRADKTEMMALVVGVDPAQEPKLTSFNLNADERKIADGLASKVMLILGGGDESTEVRLAALARAVANLAGQVESA